MTVTPTQRQQAKQTRFNPLRTITPAILTTALDSFETGYLRSAALIWETIEKRVPVVSNAVGKRKRSVSRRPWEVITTDDSPAAKQQQEDITYLCNNLTARDALRGNMRGGMPLLIKQMMDAPFKRNAVHELLWKPTAKKQITVECTFVPLWFFEETTGELRYTGPLYSSAGAALAEGEWMVTAGDGVMEAISVAYMFWKLSLEDWVNFSERFGTPGVLGRTKAAKNSPEGNAMADAVAAFGTDFEGVIYGDDGTVEKALSLIESARTGDQPFEPMVERMERTIVSLCRGADLGTLSSKDGSGASLQEDESNILEEDDCELISETLNSHLVKTALRWKYGPGVEQLVKIQITPSATTDVKQEISTDEFLIKHGVRISTNDLAERYNRTQSEAKAGEDEDGEIAGVKKAAETIEPGDAETKPGAGNREPGTEEAEAENDLESQLTAAFLEGFNSFDPAQVRDADGKWTRAGGAALSTDAGKKAQAELDDWDQSIPSEAVDYERNEKEATDWKLEQMPEGMVRVERAFKPEFKKLGGKWEWHTATTGSQYIEGSFPLNYNDAGEPLDEQEFKITIRDHGVSPFRAKEFGRPTHVIEVDDFNDPQKVSHGIRRMTGILDGLLAAAQKANADHLAEIGAALESSQSLK